MGLEGGIVSVEAGDRCAQAGGGGSPSGVRDKHGRAGDRLA